MFLICGLGNKGAAYRNTRHNMGYLVLDRFSERRGIVLARKVAGCIVGEADDTLLARPDTFMNLSGGPVSSLMRKRNIPPENLIVVHDDLDMEFGRMKIRQDGGDGGHKGVRSVADSLRTRQFFRIKIGIGRDPSIPPEDYVLSRFTKEEAPVLDQALDRAVDALHAFLSEGFEQAMNLFNRS
ncbi:MAG: aminoacyl-tRNA hydrolase [Syntrophorhabdales bacterium]